MNPKNCPKKCSVIVNENAQSSPKIHSVECEVQRFTKTSLFKKKSIFISRNSQIMMEQIKFLKYCIAPPFKSTTAQSTVDHGPDV